MSSSISKKLIKLSQENLILKSMAAKIKNNHGFTLVEMMVTIIVLGLAVAAIGSLYYNMQSLQVKSRHIDVATRAAQTQIEILRNNSYNSLTPGSTINFTSSLPDSLPHDAQGAVEVSEPVAGLRRIDVTVTYTAGSPQEVKLSSMIGVIGISQ